VDAVDGANIDTGCIFGPDAGLGDYVCHCDTILSTNGWVLEDPFPSLLYILLPV
jgi:hypothetical protein